MADNSVSHKQEAGYLRQTKHSKKSEGYIFYGADLSELHISEKQVHLFKTRKQIQKDI